MSNQANHIGENQTHHLRTILELQRQRLCTLPVWPGPPNDEEWPAQVRNIRKAAAVEAAEADKNDDGEVDKGDSKQAKPKRKPGTHRSKKKNKDSSLKRIEAPDDNLDEYFGSNEGQNSQETADVTPKTPKKSEEVKSKNDPDGSSHRRVDRSPQGSAGEGPLGSSSKSKQST